MELAGLDKAGETLRANLSPRYMRLDKLERYVEGNQYAGRPHWWNDNVPIYDREPCVVYLVAKNAIESTAELCLGEGRWPAITAEVADAHETKPKSEDEPKTPAPNAAPVVPRLPRPKPKRKAAPFDDRFALSEEDGEALDALIEAIVHQVGLRSVAREQLESAMGTCTSVAILCARDGRLCVDTTKAKWCQPEFDPRRPAEVVKLTIQYPYFEEYWNQQDRRWAVRCMLYRRVIDARSDITFLPQQAQESGEDPGGWTRDNAKSVDHELGFCPVVWYPYRKQCGTVADVDGHAIHAGQLDEIDALNFALSQRHSAAMVAASPPTIEIGVDGDHNPAPLGPQPTTAFIPDAVAMANGTALDSPANKGWVTGFAPGMARKRGPGIIWRYPEHTSKVEMLTLPGDALKPVDDDARDLRSKIAESLGVVFVDPDNAKFSAELSGKALARLYDRHIRLCNKVREDFGEGCLLAMVHGLLRLALRMERIAKGSLRLPGLRDALSVLERFEQPVKNQDGSESTGWFKPALDLTWGPYFAPDSTDEKSIVDTVKAAREAKLITKYTAVEKLRDVFAIGNVDEYLEDLEDEAAVAKAEMVAMTPPPGALGAAPGAPPAKPPLFMTPAKVTP